MVQTQNSIEKKLKTQGKNSEFRQKTQLFGIFEILQCEKNDQRKSLPYIVSKEFRLLDILTIFLLKSLLCDAG